MKKFLLSAVAIAMLSTAASAADLDVAPEPIIDNWAGWYAGVNVGYGFANDPDTDVHNDFYLIEQAFETSREILSLNRNSSYRLDPEASGFFGGGQVGYNWQGDGLVYGLEGDFQFSDIDGRDSIQRRGLIAADQPLTGQEANLVAPLKLNGNGSSGPIASARHDLKWFSTVRGRVGLPLGETFLFYATAGLAFGEIKNKGVIDEGMYGLNYTASSSKTKVGWTVGFGSEMKVTENVSFKVEYLYLDLGKRTLNAEGECVMSDYCPVFFTEPPAARYKFKNQFHTVKAGLNWGF